jgi:hypothetical protein
MQILTMLSGIPVPDAVRRIQRGNAHEFPYGFAYIRCSVYHYRLSVRLGKASQSSNGRGRAVRTVRANVVKDWGGYAGECISEYRQQGYEQVR